MLTALDNTVEFLETVQPLAGISQHVKLRDFYSVRQLSFHVAKGPRADSKRRMTFDIEIPMPTPSTLKELEKSPADIHTDLNGWTRNIYEVDSYCPRNRRLASLMKLYCNDQSPSSETCR